MTGSETLRARGRRGGSRYLRLLIVLIAFVLLYALLDPGPRFRLFLNATFLAVILILFRTIADRGVWFLTAAFLGIATLPTIVTGQALERISILIPGFLMLAMFLGLTAVVILRDVVRDRVVTGDTILGAVCVYLLIGVFWAFLYALVLLVNPGAFQFPEPSVESNPVLLGRGIPMIYFSFVTLTTLGYGDITPLTHLARTLCWMEAAFGQIYLAVLIARLVGLHITHSDQRPAT